MSTTILKLKLPTDPLWVKNVVEKNIEEILTDHAYCEQKAASNAISMIVMFPQYSDIVAEMADLAIEEMDHFRRVHEFILKRGYTFGFERKDDYVNELVKFVRKGYNKKILLLDKLLFAAMVEARSCERFKVLKENIGDEELSEFYNELMISEANHYTTFIKLAKKHISPKEVDERWEEWLAYEAKVIKNYGKKETVHG